MPKYRVTVEVQKLTFGESIGTVAVRDTMILNNWREVERLHEMEGSEMIKAPRTGVDIRPLFKIVRTEVVQEPTPGTAEQALAFIRIVIGGRAP